MKKTVSLGLLFIGLSFQACQPQTASAQNFVSSQQGSTQQLESMLERIEPSPGPIVQQNTSQVTGGSFAPTGNSVPVNNFAPAAPIQSSPMQRMMSLFNGGQPQQQQQQQAPQGRKGLFQTLFGPDTSGSASDNMYRAENQASIARNACSRSYYGSYDTRSGAADEAYYAAEEARREADNAAAKVGGSDPQAAHYASIARGYAEQAQNSADTARANADRAYK